MQATPRSRKWKWLFWLVVVPALLFAVYLWFVVTWSYSLGERAGYIQKFSKRGWLCKTWEGELALITMPGTVAEKFLFTVRDEDVARRVNATMGQRVSLDYEQHIGIPTSCFGDSQYFVTDVRVVAEPSLLPSAPSAPPVPSAPSAPPAAEMPATPAEEAGSEPAR
jgi:hypothetical protein